jgi:4-hydroxybenzoyl-CoA thioesterase
VPYEHKWIVRFGQVDQAGIIYYPELFNAVHHGVEDMLIEAGVPFWDLVRDRGVGMPIVHAEADYRNPIRYGTTVDIVITPVVGQSSIGFEAEGAVDSTLVFTALQKHVTIDMDRFESIPIPDDVGDHLAPYTA